MNKFNVGDVVRPENEHVAGTWNKFHANECGYIATTETEFTVNWVDTGDQSSYPPEFISISAGDFKSDQLWLASDFEIVRPAANTQARAADRGVGSAIVCKIVDGHPRPSRRPYVHMTSKSATTEAQRLADANGGTFGVYCLAGVFEKSMPTYAHEWQRFAAEGQIGRAADELSKMSGLPWGVSYAVVCGDWRN